MQTTLKSQVTLSGIGLHSGEPATVTLKPASAQYGIWFRRSDIEVGDALIPARWDVVATGELCTRIENRAGASVMTIEHLMAAIAGTGLNNVLIEIDGPEVPALDGSAAPFVDAILSRGLVEQHVPVMVIEVLEPVTVRSGAAWARLEPSTSLEIDFEIDFAEPAIGRQKKSLNMANGAFVRELCDSRTFCRAGDIAAMHGRGLALGGEPGTNAVVFDGDRVASPGGLRHVDEPVRHKMLDALGDLALAGAPLLARYSGHRAGHAVTNTLLRALFARPEAFRLTVCDTATARHLPGVGVRRRDIPQTA
ncbi:MAG: UDP-3-O-acyl-N-acetylglucosamine deacetylase [Pseudomonadota bacterium]